MMKNKMLIALITVLGILALAGCSQEQAADGKLKITATTGMIADLAAEIGGEHVVVTGLMGPGTDPHLYQASHGDVRKLDNADIIFYNGLHLEGKMAEIFEKLESKKTTVAVSANLTKEQLMADAAQGGDAVDPHIWFDVKLWMAAAETVSQTLIEKDEANKSYYEERKLHYLKQLEELDLYAHEQIALIPEKRRILVTAHDAFGYFGRAYGLTVTGLQGMNTMSEYGSKDVSKLRDYLVENEIKAVFIESSVSPKSIESVIDGARSLGHEVKIGGELFSDAMGEAGTSEGTYIGMVKHNIDTLVEALK